MIKDSDGNICVRGSGCRAQRKGKEEMITGAGQVLREVRTAVMKQFSDYPINGKYQVKIRNGKLIVTPNPNRISKCTRNQSPRRTSVTC